MKKNTTLPYLAAWITYIAFAFAAFPELQITVMLYSIPLTMLGGWLYNFRGALLTTLATIPLHYLLLIVYSDDTKVVQEAFNPFGIGTQLIFSCATALLKSSHVRYHQLNNSLEELVAERTQDLEKLTNYLIDTRQLENRELSTSLLEQPYKQLQSMLAASFLLKQKLEAEQHPRASDANNIHSIISFCLKHLQSLEDYSISNAPITDDIEVSIQNLIHQIDGVSDTRVIRETSPAWSLVNPDHTRYLCEIVFESVANALRHAEPTEIRIGIVDAADEVTVYVENDGAPLLQGHKEGMGLPLMRYRATKMGARLSIAPTQSGRTRVECAFPRARQKAPK